MANTLGVYDPIFYANEALQLLYKNLGMAARIFLGIDQERKARPLGSVINIRRPSTFTTQAGGTANTYSDVNTQTVAMTLDNWREVKFKLTDQELAYTGERIIRDHIQPAAYALADYIDQQLVTMINKIPYKTTETNAAQIGNTVVDIIKTRKLLVDNAVPLDDVHFMIDSTAEANFLALSNFTQYTGAGDVGVNSQLRGTLGTKFGAEIFVNQNTPAIQTGAGDTDVLGTATGVQAKGTTNLVCGGFTGSVTALVRAGDSLTIAGHPYRYAITGAATSSSGVITIPIFPGLELATAGAEVVTIDSPTSGGAVTLYNQLMFHRNAFAMAMAPLSEMGNELGAKIATVTDPVTGISLRSRVFYIGDISTVVVALDILFGFQVLNRAMAARITSTHT